jgi:radical SAM superfamily enzyme YgiQ (UPF0313 family)
LDEEEVRRASLIAFYLPMHTATRLALPVIDRVRHINPQARIAAFGLYAPLAERLLYEHGVSFVLGPEAEAELVELSRGSDDRVIGRSGDLIGRSVDRVTAEPGDRKINRSSDSIARSPDHAIARFRNLPKLSFITPDRDGLPRLEKYATLQMPDGHRRLVAATDASRGCKHRCRHCPIVPVYNGQFRVVPVDVVLADIDQQVEAGAEHVTFGDPDFFNGPTHARRIVEALHARHPALTYDVTVKVEHLVGRRALLPALADTGCLFLTSAVESIDDSVLMKLEKGHTRADFLTAVQLCRDAGVPMVPTFVAFTPWTTIEGYQDLLRTIADLGLIDHVAPVQWGLRLLVTQGSRLLELDDIRARVDQLDSRTLTYPWRHDDPRVDALQAEIVRAVGMKQTVARAEIFATVCSLAGVTPPRESDIPSRATIPYLNEPWYC